MPAIVEKGDDLRLMSPTGRRIGVILETSEAELLTNFVELLYARATTNALRNRPAHCEGGVV